MTPRGQVQKHAARSQFPPVTLVSQRGHQIPGTHEVCTDFIKREPHIALALIRSVVDHHDERWNALLIPSETDETVPCPVAVPCRRALQQTPLPVLGLRPMDAI